jgi:GntR family transcriptional regulator
MRGQEGELHLPPTYREIAEDLATRIDSGEYPRGSVLPSTRELADEHGVSKGTIHRAIRLLQEEGLVVGRQGRGQFVRGRPGKTP